MSPSIQPDSDHFRTLQDGPEVEIKIRGSIFRARAFHVLTEIVARQRLDASRKRYHDASHHCWAMRLGTPEDPFERVEDDGEPAQTAGLPILRPMQREGLLQSLVLVVRWFGGTKLGTGGLVRAYGESAQRALDAAGRRTCWREEQLELQMEYADLGAVEAVLNREADCIRSVRRRFSPGPQMSIHVLRSQAERLRHGLIEATGGRVRISRADVESR